jgi:hypothetical protein
VIEGAQLRVIPLVVRLLVFRVAVRIVLVVGVLKCVRGKRERMREKGRTEPNHSRKRREG